MIEVRTPCRLHFGLLAYGGEGERQYGGVGLMVRKPDIALRVERGPMGCGVIAEGPMGDRAAGFAQRFIGSASASGLIAEPIADLSLRVIRAPRAHTGLGTGTQLAMAVARALAELHELPDLDAASLAKLAARGQRSAIGAHGFVHGGLIVEGGKRRPDDLSPMLLRQPMPEHWRIVLVTPRRLEGLAGARERRAFAALPPVDRALTAEMCRLVVLGLLPSLAEADAEGFGEALFALQQLAGQTFKSAQGGLYADPLLEQIVEHTRRWGVRGVGQSSWGPTLYAVTIDQEQAERLAGELQRRFGLGAAEVLVTEADNAGGGVRRVAEAASVGPQSY